MYAGEGELVANRDGTGEGGSLGWVRRARSSRSVMESAARSPRGEGGASCDQVLVFGLAAGHSL